ncbi:hypothetical protein BKA64DRAFT_636745 [Cadophora sp. MPI-SDFR-AT-0126]|nr:hypothetical protein BKA64DRAFT_636745 [Leotiomycetes sp. MPI-SDFR-AT-0126]
MDAKEKPPNKSNSSVERQITAKADSQKANTKERAKKALARAAMASRPVIDAEPETQGEPPIDYEYDSHQDSDASESSRNILPITERHVLDQVDVGEAIAFVYPADWDYDIDDERHMFDDGLSSDEDEEVEDVESSESESSSNYEELSKGIRNASDCEEDNEEEECEVNGEASENDAASSNVDGDLENSLISGSEYDDDTPADNTEIEVTPTKTPASPIKVPATEPKALDELLRADIHLKKEGEARDKLHWKVQELYEILHEIERQILKAESNLQAAEVALESVQEDNKEDIVTSGLSLTLFEAFKDFCESLHPRYGLREGFSIELDGSHGGPDTTWGMQYPVLYDLAFKAAKEGSAAAIDMLVRLPAVGSKLRGSIFEYKPEELMLDHFVESRR